MIIKKIKRFDPIEIILETQEEADAMFALCNHSKIQKICNLQPMWKYFEDHELFTSEYYKYHRSLEAIIK